MNRHSSTKAKRSPVHIFRRGLRQGITAFLCLQAYTAHANSTIFAYRLFNRLNGTPPTREKLAEMAGLIDQGKFDEAGKVAVNDPSGNFYNITLRDVFTRWTNRDQSPRSSLNDVVATAIGIVRDDLSFGRFLYDDISYIPESQPAYSVGNADSYANLEARDPNFVKDLKKTTQTPALPPGAVAGVFSLRGFAEAFYSAGTNRRAVAFTMKNFLCRPMESLSDTSRSDDRVRRDVSRSPGGYLEKYKTECVGCHAGMDALAGAFAYYDFANGQLAFTQGVVQPKFSRNSGEFPDGYVTTDDSWINHWAEGRNQSLGWGTPANGNGARSFGELIASTQAFADCMAETAVESMCSREYDPNRIAVPEDKDAIDTIAKEFKASGNLKTVYIKAAIYCSK